MKFLSLPKFEYEKHFIYLICFLAFSFLIFWPSILGDPFWDDWVFIFKNHRSILSSPSPLIFFPGGSQSRSWPIFYTALWAMLKVFKDQYFLYHIVSISLHGINGYLCFRILDKLKVRYSFLLATLFVVHPLHLFTVSWIIQVKTVLSIFFFLNSLLLGLYYFEKEKVWWLVCSIFFFLLSIFTKATTVAFAACIPLIYPAIKEKVSLRKFTIYFLIPFVALAAVATIRTAWTFNIREYLVAEKAKENPSAYSIYNYAVDEKPKDPDLVPYDQTSPITRILITTKNFYRYLEYIAFPFNGHHLFQEKTDLTYMSSEFLLIFIYLIAFFYFCRYLYKNKLYKEQIGFTFFCASLIPFCGLVYIPIYGLTNFIPYWLSIPFLGLLPLLAHFSKKVLIALVIFFAGITHWQAYEFINVESIFLDSIKLTQDSKIYQVSLIEHYVNTNHCAEAASTYKNFVETEFTLMFCLEKKIKECKPSEALK